MTAIAAPDLAALWDRAAGARPGIRAAALLQFFGVDANASVGDGERGLARAYADLFGRELPGLADCPSCAETVECALDAEVLAEAPDARERAALLVDDCEIEWRTPSASDVAHAASLRDARFARDELVGCCVLEVRRGSERLPRSQWPAEAVDAVERAIVDFDPMTAASASLSCPACGATFEVGLDVGALLWAELDSQARELFADVHRLAVAYGWSESEILNMSPRRRALYRAMSQG